MQQLVTWHNDTEKKLQNYSEKGSLEEKNQQYNKFQVKIIFSSFLKHIILINIYKLGIC